MSERIEDVLLKDGYVIHAVEGDSMMPMLDQSTDLVKITPILGRLKKGDLPLYKRPSGQYVLHRIIAVRKKYCITCGDNRSLTEKVPYGWMIGVMQGYYKNGRYIPADDKDYLAYVKKMCLRRGVIGFLLKFKIFRALRKLKNIILGKRSGHDAGTDN